MYFANFKDLKIQKEFKFITKNICLEVRNLMPISEIKAEVDKKIKEVIDQPTSLPVLYEFEIAAADTEITNPDDDAQFMLTLANIVVPTTLQALETGKGYKRERRLDAPDALKALHTSYGTIKRACNHEVLTQIMNIKINSTFGYFLLCDGKDVVLAEEGDSNE